MSDKHFEEFIDAFLGQIGHGKGLIFGVSDTTPPTADFNRLKRIAQKIKNLEI